MSRTSLVFQSQGDPFLGALGGLVKRVVGGGLFKRGASKIVQIARSPVGRAVGGVLAAGGIGAVAGRVLGAGPGLPGGFTVLKASRTGKPLRILTPQGRIINLVRRRGGISSVELRGFRKVVSLLGRVGMTPKRLGGRRRPRKGNPE